MVIDQKTVHHPRPTIIPPHPHNFYRTHQSRLGVGYTQS